MAHLCPDVRAWTIASVRYDSPVARELTHALHREQVATFGTADDPDTTPAEQFEPPAGMFLVATCSDRIALACGGWHTAGPTTAEIKRMYVDPSARGRGLGRWLVDALELDARRRGMTEVILETGIHNRAAMALYISCGYALVEPYVAGRDPRINRALGKFLPPLAECE